MDYARFNYCTTRRQGVRFIRQMGPYDHYAVVGLPRNSKLGTPEAEVPTLDKWILEKREINV
jgi:hypothetical protein